MAAAILRRIQNPNPRPSLLLRLLSAQPQLQTKPQTPDVIARLKSQIRSESDPDRLASLLISSVSTSSVRGDRPLYTFTIRHLAAAKRHDLIDRVLTATTSSCNPSTGLLIRVISLYSEAAMLDHAVKTFHLVKPASDHAFCALLSAFFENREYRRVVDSFSHLPAQLGFAPEVASYNVLIKSLVALDDLGAARNLLDEMHKKGLKPDIISCNEILNGYWKKDDHVGFQEWLKEINKRRLKPNVVTYNLRMAALCAKAKSSEAEELLEVMISRDVYPNRASFNTVIAGFCKEGEVGAAVAVFKRMGGLKRPDGTTVLPSFETYIMLIKGLVEKGVWGPAVEVCKECLEKKWAPPFQSVKALVDGLVKSAEVDKAKEVVKGMRKVVKGDAAVEWRKVESAFSF